MDEADFYFLMHISESGWQDAVWLYVNNWAGSFG